MSIASNTIWIIDNFEGGKKSAFAKRVGIAPSYVTLLIGDSNYIPSERIIESICNAYGIFRDWYVNDIGDPFGPMDRAKTVAKIVNRAMARSPEADRQKIISMATAADDAHIVLLAQVLEEMFGPLPDAPEE